MFVDHIVLRNVSHNDDRLPDSLKAKALLRAVWETLSWRRVLASLNLATEEADQKRDRTPCDDADQRPAKSAQCKACQTCGDWQEIVGRVIAVNVP